MDDAARVRAIERVGGLLEPVERLLSRNAAAVTEAIEHRATVEVLHDDQGPSVVLADVEDGDDVAVARESGGGVRLPLEARAGLGLLGVPLRRAT